MASVAPVSYDAPPGRLRVDPYMSQREAERRYSLNYLKPAERAARESRLYSGNSFSDPEALGKVGRRGHTKTFGRFDKGQHGVPVNEALQRLSAKAAAARAAGDPEFAAIDLNLKKCLEEAERRRAIVANSPSKGRNGVTKYRSRKEC
ncbi:MAG: hypothetical protein [Microvirus sp.]|nr:MAG: hypothetical protein [Microvirus sp.]